MVGTNIVVVVVVVIGGNGGGGSGCGVVVVGEVDTWKRRAITDDARNNSNDNAEDVGGCQANKEGRSRRKLDFQ